MTASRSLLACLLAALAAVPGAAEARVPPHRADGQLADWRGEPTMLSGRTTISRGELIYDDYLFDDYGPDLDRGPNRPPVNSPLTMTTGDYRYPADVERYGHNAADLRQLRIAADRDALHVLVLLETMKTLDASIATVAIDTDGDAATGTADWADGSGIRTPGADRFVTLWGGGGRVTDASGTPAPVESAASLDENAFEARVPRELLGPISDRARVWVVVGLAGRGGSYLEQRPGAAAAFDVGFQGKERYGKARVSGDGIELLNLWSDRRQSAALARGDLSDFARPLDIAALERRDTIPFRLEPGFYNRIFRSKHDFGEGVFAGSTDSFDPKEVVFKSPYQPYGLYIPEGYDPARPSRLLIDGHSFSLNMNQYAGISPNRLRQLGDERDAVIVTPFARGPDVSYLAWGMADVLEAWDDARRHYNVDDDRTDVSGQAAGGYLAYRLGLLMPDRFTRAAVHLGPPKHPTYFGPGLPNVAPPGYEVKGDNLILIPNALNLSFELNYSTAAPLVPITGGKHVEQLFREAGNPYRFYDNPAAVEPFDVLVFDEWGHSGEWLGEGTRSLSPLRVRYVRYPVNDLPQYGLRFDRAYWVADLDVREVTGDASHGEIDATTFAFGGRLPKPVVEQPRVEPPAPGAASPEVVTGQHLADGPPIERRNAFEATFRNVIAVRFLTWRMGLSTRRPLTASLAGDGATTVRFSGRWPRRLRATLDGEPVRVRRERRGAIALDLVLTRGQTHALEIAPERRP